MIRHIRHLRYLIRMEILLIVIMVSSFEARENTEPKFPYELTIHAFGSPGILAISGVRGHTWLTIKNNTDSSIKFLSYKLAGGETMSLALWPDSYSSTEGRGGVFINMDMIEDDGVEGVWTYSIPISRSKLKKIEDATPGESYYHDGFDLRNSLWHNCTTYAVKMWNLVADVNHRIVIDFSSKVGTLGADVPGTVAGKIKKWVGSRKITFKPQTKIQWKDVYYFSKKSGELFSMDTFTISNRKITLTKGTSKALQYPRNPSLYIGVRVKRSKQPLQERIKRSDGRVKIQE